MNYTRLTAFSREQTCSFSIGEGTNYIITNNKHGNSVSILFPLAFSLYPAGGILAQIWITKYWPCSTPSLWTDRTVMDRHKRSIAGEIGLRKTHWIEFNDYDYAHHFVYEEHNLKVDDATISYKKSKDSSPGEDLDSIYYDNSNLFWIVIFFNVLSYYS